MEGRDPLSLASGAPGFLKSPRAHRLDGTQARRLACGADPTLQLRSCAGIGAPRTISRSGVTSPVACFRKSPGRLAVAVMFLLCLAVDSLAIAQPTDVRTITMRVAVDERYRILPDWETTLRNTVQRVSDIYERYFQVRFVILDIVDFAIGPDAS